MRETITNTDPRTHVPNTVLSGNLDIYRANPKRKSMVGGGVLVKDDAASKRVFW